MPRLSPAMLPPNSRVHPQMPHGLQSGLTATSSREGPWARALREIEDRRNLTEMDDHLLGDIGLTRGDVARGLPFKRAEPQCLPNAALSMNTEAASPAGLCRIATLSAREWRLKLYAPAAERAGLRAEDVALASRAVRAVVAEPRPIAMSGFATLRLSLEGGEEYVAGTLILTAWWWESAALHRLGLLLPADGGAPRRAAGCVSDRLEVLLMTAECAAWHRFVLGAASPRLSAYLAEDCA